MNQTIIEEQRFLCAEDVAKMLGVSTVTGYRIIKKLNDQLKEQGYIVVAGKISKRYFNEKVYM